MADKPISGTDVLTDPVGSDLLVVVDVSEPLLSKRTKHLLISTIFGRPTAIGSLVPSTGSFISLTIGPTTIDEFSTDGTLFDNSDTALPTEQAVKTYVDTQISLLGSPYQIIDGDSRVTVNDTASLIEAYIDNVQILSISSSGLLLQSGVYANEISNDVTLSDDSPTSLVTEHAIKTYIDNAVVLGGTSGTSGTSGINGSSGTSGTSGIGGGGGSEEIVRYIYSDATASAGEILFIDSTSGNIDIFLDSLPKGKITVKKISTDSNTITVYSLLGYTIDGQLSKTLTTPYQSFVIYCDETIFFVL